MTVRFDDVHLISRVDYTWVHMSDIEKRMPISESLTEPGLDGLFRIPVESHVIPSTRYIVLRAVYTHGGDSYGLVTAKHFTNTYTDTKGHKVKRISVLARAPLAWVKINTHNDTTVPHLTYPYTGDMVCGHQPDVIVSRIYANMNRYVNNTLVFTSYTPDSGERDSLASELVSETLSILAAPLAFKALHEQSRLTLERLQCPRDRDILTIPDPHRALWGTCVLWQLDSELGTLSRATVNQQTDLAPVPSAARWLRVRLTCMGLEVTRCSEESATKDNIQAPYWAVVLTALCCGALDRWSQELDKQSRALRVDVSLLLSEGEKNELCQRCGYAYRISPVVCESRPKRVSAVLQIDNLLLGGICTTLCATVTRHNRDGSIEAGSEKQARYQADREQRYCLNHRRVYRASCEEQWELDKWKGEYECREGEEVDQSQGEEDFVTSTARITPRCERRAKQIASWWEDDEMCYWGQETDKAGNRADHRQKYRSGTISSTYRRREEQEDRCRKKQKSTSKDHKEDSDPGWWLWQKDCRQRQSERLGYYTHGERVRKHRFWELYLSGSHHRGAEHSRYSTSIGLWQRFSCNVVQYHIKTIPFGHQGGALNI